MKRIMGWVAVGVALVSFYACCAKQDGKDSADASKDPNVAVSETHWGEKRVVYAADVAMWDSEKTEPGEEQWDQPQRGRLCCKFTYYGDKLVRLETFGTDGKPFQSLKAGQRIEWLYGPRGKLLEETGYGTDGEIDEHNTRRYDEAGRLIERVYGYGTDTVVSKTTYQYADDGKHPASCATYEGDGRLSSKSTFAYSPNGTTRTERFERYDHQGTPEPVVEFKQQWNGNKQVWEVLGDE